MREDLRRQEENIRRQHIREPDGGQTRKYRSGHSPNVNWFLLYRHI